VAEPFDVAFEPAVRALEPGPARAPSAPVRDGTALTGEQCRRLFEAQVASRHLDLAARALRARGRGYYTIGSAGHEGNAAVAAALRLTDPALLHYRSGGFYAARAAQRPGHDARRDVLLGMLAARPEPMAGGRHKVFGHPELAILPQTSTIASHLPRAVGVALAIERARRLDMPSPWPADAVAVCSFGDASLNHSTAVGALNATAWHAHTGHALPLLLVCEDNRLGISVPTPEGWVRAALTHLPGVRYLSADGCDLADAFDAATEAVAAVRSERRPVVLHLRTVRFGGHAGSDVEASYRSADDVRADVDDDPLVGTARLLVEAGLLTPDEVVGHYERTRREIAALAESLLDEPELADASEVMAPLAPRRPVEVARSVRDHAPASSGSDTEPLTLARAVNAALAELLDTRSDTLVFGEDVGVKGGVYGVTRGLQKRFGADRVFDTLLDEQTVLGIALGAAVSGFVPIPEIEYLAYLHNAEDQLRGEAATLSFFSNGQYRNPMVVRVAGYGYQKGFGGHFHNDNAVGVLRDIPGLVIASPSSPDDAAAMLRTCVAAAAVDGSVCVFLEPIALYHTTDLYEPGDGAWAVPYPTVSEETHVPVGGGRVHGAGTDLTIVTCGNGVYLSRRVARRLAGDGIAARVLDLRWLAPLPHDDIVREAALTGRVLVVDETRRTGGVSEGVLAALVDAGFDGAMARVASEDSFIPLGDAANHVLLSEATIEAAARKLTS